MVGKTQIQHGKRYLKRVPTPQKNRHHDRLLKQAARQQAKYQRMSWREYQQSLNRTKNYQRRVRRLFILFGILVFSSAAVYSACSLLLQNGLNTGAPPEKQTISNPSSDHPVNAPSHPDKTDIRNMLAQTKLLNLTEERLDLNSNGQRYRLETSLDPRLQHALIKRFDKVNSRYIGIVAMDPNSGRILAFAGFNKTEEKLNPCTTNKFPAASIFKIVTAAAVAEKYGYTGDTLLKFNGYKHTLYKNQLKESDNRYTNRISFRNSFAQSVNPVFGKLGSLRLGKDALEQFGALFGFNHQFNSDMEISPSHLSVSEEIYHHAEIASGFNRDTTISPVHAAMMVSSALNGGHLIEATIVDRVVNASGDMIYQGAKSVTRPIITGETAAIIHGLMESTVKVGTARKAFRGYRRDKVLKRLIIGGKTGSIFNRAHDARFDWFVGFAEAKNLSEKLVISAVVAHEEYIGRRAAEYARLAFSTYFENYFAEEDAKQRMEEKS